MSDRLVEMTNEDIIILNARIATVLIDRNELSDPKKKELVVVAIEQLIKNYKTVLEENAELKRYATKMRTKALDDIAKLDEELGLS
jgi:hypothetical protein